MTLIHDHLHGVDPALPRVPLSLDRFTLAKRRWRGTAADGREFGFEGEHPLVDGDIVLAADAVAYVVAQMPEAALRVQLTTDPAAAARLGWLIGNLHFQLEIVEGAVRVADDPALRLLFEREHVEWQSEEAVFRPQGGGHSHAH